MNDVSRGTQAPDCIENLADDLVDSPIRTPGLVNPKRMGVDPVYRDINSINYIVELEGYWHTNKIKYEGDDFRRFARMVKDRKLILLAPRKSQY